MLVDINFKPFTEDHIARYRAMVEQHNAKYPEEEHLPLEMTHPKRYARGIFVADSNMSLRSIKEHCVEDVPAYHHHLRSTDDLQSYFSESRKYKRMMDKMYSQRFKKGPYRGLESYGAYGLCDTPEQLLEVFPHLDGDDVPRFITVNGVLRKHQPSSGGFRYHKWGQYVGKQKPRSEYLYDDKHIDMVVNFHIYRVEDLITG